MKCSQCDRSAVVVISGESGEIGIPLCVRCDLMHEQAETLLFFRQASVANQLRSGVEDSLGLPRSRRFAVPAVVLNSGGEATPTTNINFHGCDVGFVNSGTITAIDSALGILNGSGQRQIAAAIQALVSATVQDNSLTEEQKRRVIESLEDVSEQAATPEKHRKSGRTRALLGDIKNTLQGAAAAGKVWEQWGKHLLDFF